jgi:hypothetical protein
MTETLKVKIKGTRPLLMHSTESLGKKAARGQSAPDPKEEAKMALYRDKDGKIAVPSLNILSAMKAAAKDSKVPGKGKKSFSGYVFAGLHINPDYIPIETGGKPEESWEVDVRPVAIQRARIMRARPKFNNWSLTFELEILDPIIRPSDVKDILANAGKYVGLCDFRPLFGLFEVVEFKESKGA